MPIQYITSALQNVHGALVQKLPFQKADLAIADLTITYEREQAVDFTMPFMNLGILCFGSNNDAPRDVIYPCDTLHWCAG